jgi:hypothetical protein
MTGITGGRFMGWEVFPHLRIPAICLALVVVLIWPPLSIPGEAPVTETAKRAEAFSPWWNYSWGFRKTATIDNMDNPNTLSAYQIKLNISYSSHMKPDFSDLRFAQYNSSGNETSELPYWIEKKTDDASASLWVKVDRIQGAGNSTISMYYGNSNASSVSNLTATFDVVSTFDSGLDGWTYTGTTGYSLSLDAGQGNPAPSAHISGDYVVSTVAANAYMERTLSKGPGTGLAITVDYRASSGTTTSACTNAYLWVADMGDNILNCSSYVAGGVLDTGWSYNQQKTVLTEIQNISQAKVRLGLGDSWAANWNQKNWFDNIRIRKCTSPEPTCDIGVEEMPFTLKRMESAPKFPSEADPVTINATLHNPMSYPISLTMSFRWGNDFETSEPLNETGTILAPIADTNVSIVWTAKGGANRIWAAAYGNPLAWRNIEVNRNPVLQRIKDQSLWQGVEFNLQLNASDPDGDTLTWSIDNPLLNLTPLNNRSAQLNVIPTNDDVGVHRVNITVRDPMNRTASMRINFTVNNVNDPPTLTKIPSLSATQYKELRYQALASDPDIKWGDVLTFSDNTDLFDIDGMSGVFFFTPAEERVGKHNVKVTVTDIEGASETSTFTITVANVNDPPTLEILPPQFTLQGRAFQLKVAAADPDLKSDPTEKLRFSDDCPLFNINNDTGMISFTPSNDDLGVWRANITVTDRGGLSNITRLTITVMNANDPPAIEAIPAQTATEEQPFSYQCMASDPDLRWGLDNLTFSDDTDMFNIDSKTGAIAFTPTGAQVGSRRITITVKDERGASVSASFDITVVHVNHPPFDVTVRFPLDGARLKEGEQMWLDGTARDNDKGDELEFNWLDNGNPVGMGKNISVNLKPGKHKITLEVSDGTETVRAEANLEVARKESISVAGNDWTIVASGVAALVALLVLAGVLAIRRGRRTMEPPGAAQAVVSSGPEEETTALPTVPPPEASGPEPEAQNEANRIMGSAVEHLADYQEAHPEEALDVEPAMEKLDIARGFLKSGEYDDALAFAMEADAAVNNLTHAASPSRVAVKKKKKAMAKKRECPGCGEILEPEWPACPVCGHGPL